MNDDSKSQWEDEREKRRLARLLNPSNKEKTQAYDLSKKTKEAIQKICIDEQRSESFIVSRILNKIFDPLVFNNVDEFNEYTKSNEK